MARGSTALETLTDESPPRAQQGLTLAALATLPPEGADADDVRAFAQGLPERFLYCREMGHNWRPFSAGSHPDGGFERVLRCVRCKAKRFQTISSAGVVLGSRYEHPEGYLSEGLGRIVGEGRGALRLESMRRIVAKYAGTADTDEQGG